MKKKEDQRGSDWRLESSTQVYSETRITRFLRMLLEFITFLCLWLLNFWLVEGCDRCTFVKI